jgi:soluble P-type ATPase
MADGDHDAAKAGRKAMLTIDLRGGDSFELESLVLDINGTLTDHGTLVEGVAERLGLLADVLQIHVLTADTYGTAEGLARRLTMATFTTIADGAEKAARVEALGADRVVAIGNGRNDEAMLRAARLGIVVLGTEGAATSTILAADVACATITDALDLLLDERAITATLRP